MWKDEVRRRQRPARLWREKVGEAYEGKGKGASSSSLCGDEATGDGDSGGAHSEVRCHHRPASG
jgi:hypothetical protein